MNLSFGNPALLWGLLAALVPLAVHLFFRRRPRPISFPAIEFVLRARRETQRRLRLKRILLFTARTLTLAALALALARPKWKGAEEAGAVVTKGPSAVAIVIDASASMTYRLRGTTLFERAREDALAALDSLSGEEPATVIVCGGAEPRGHPPMGFDRAALRRILREAQPRAGHSDMTGCVAAAARALSDPKTSPSLGRRVVVATDMTAAAWRLDVPAPMVTTVAGPQRPEVALLDAARGSELPNVAVTDLAFERDLAVGPRGYRVTTSLARHAGKVPERADRRRSATPPDVELKLHAGAPGAPVAIRSYVQVQEGGLVRKSLVHRFPEGGPAVLTAALPPDALEIDDARTVTLAIPREVRALVVNGAPSPVKYRDEAFFVETALSSPASPVRATLLDVESLGNVRFRDHDVVFLLNVRSLGGKGAELRQFVEGGGGLFVAMGDQIDPDRYDEDLAKLLPRPLHVVKTAGERGAHGAGARAARFADFDWTHPALQVFSGSSREGIEGVQTWKYVLLKPVERKGSAAIAERVLISYDDGAPALVEARRGAGRVMLYTSTVDRSWSDWSIRTSFLPVIQRLAAWLSSALEERHDSASIVDAPRIVSLGEGQKLLALIGPDGRERPLSALERQGKSGGASVTPDRPGLWNVKVEERGQATVDPRLAFAVSPDSRESDTTRLHPHELTAYFGGQTHARIASDDPARERQTPLWSVLLLLGLVAFFAEGLLLV